jgi:hypothetical protein
VVVEQQVEMDEEGGGDGFLQEEGTEEGQNAAVKCWSSRITPIKTMPEAVKS